MKFPLIWFGAGMLFLSAAVFFFTIYNTNYEELAATNPQPHDHGQVSDKLSMQGQAHL